MKLSYVKLNDAEVATALKELPQWTIDDSQLTRSFAFKSYPEGALFAVAVCRLAEQLNHHPDIKIGYGKVEVSMSTHDVQGLSPYDFELARRISTLA